jgi:hypothetical protein
MQSKTKKNRLPRYNTRYTAPAKKGGGEMTQPTTPRPQVDERIVYAFLDMMTARIDEPDLFDPEMTTAQFWERDAKTVKTELFEAWREFKSSIVIDLQMTNAFNGIKADAPEYDDTGLFLVGYDVETAK